MEAAPGVTDSGACAGVVNNLRSAISVTKPPCCKDGGFNSKETTPEEDFIVCHNDSDINSERKIAPEDVVSSGQDTAHRQCQEQVNEILYIKNGGDKTWRLYNPFNLWRDKSYNAATAEIENAVDVVSCESSVSCRHVLNVVCTDNTNIESAFSMYRVLPTSNASNLSKQNIYPSECNIDVSDGKRNIDVRPFEGTNKHEEQLATSTNSFRSLIFGPITNLFQFSLRHIYPCPSPVVSSNCNCENMGNLQGSESKSKGGGGIGKSPAKGKKDKSGKKSPAKELLKHKAPAPPPPTKSNSGTSGVQQKAVPPQGNVPTAGSHASHNGTAAPNQSAVPNAETTYVVTDSWRHVKKLAIRTPAPNNTTLLTPPSRDSSSESVFTDPLTPQGFAEAQNHSSYYSDTCSTEQANEPAAHSAYFQTLSVDGTDHDSVFISLTSDVGMVGSDGGSDKDRNGGCTSLSTTDLDDVTLTLVDSTEQLTDGEDMGGSDFMPSVSKKPQSHSLDALDEEDYVEDSDKKTKSLDALEVTAGVGAMPHTRSTQPPSSFTVVKHRKVELNPTRLSENCLMPSGKHSQQFCRNTKNYSRLHIWN